MDASADGYVRAETCKAMYLLPAHMQGMLLSFRLQIYISIAITNLVALTKHIDMQLQAAFAAMMIPQAQLELPCESVHQFDLASEQCTMSESND